jgi:hypothetical protein
MNNTVRKPNRITLKNKLDSSAFWRNTVRSAALSQKTVDKTTFSLSMPITLHNRTNQGLPLTVAHSALILAMIFCPYSATTLPVAIAPPSAASELWATVQGLL